MRNQISLHMIASTTPAFPDARKYFWNVEPDQKYNFFFLARQDHLTVIFQANIKNRFDTEKIIFLYQKFDFLIQ